MKKKLRFLKRGTIMMIIGIIMIAGALSLAIYNHHKETVVGEKSEEILSELQQLIVKNEQVTNAPEEQTAERPYELETGNNISDKPTDVAEDETNTESDEPKESETERETLPKNPNDMDYTKIDGKYYIGILNLPTLNMTFPIQWGWSDELMDISPCRYNGNLEENNIILLAHNYSTHFGRLFEMQVGDRLTFADVHGNLYRYEVSYTESFHRSQIHHIYEGDWDMTLFTCVPNTYNRYAVRCRLLEVVKA